MLLAVGRFVERAGRVRIVPDAHGGVARARSARTEAWRGVRGGSLGCRLQRCGGPLRSLNETVAKDAAWRGRSLHVYFEEEEEEEEEADQADTILSVRLDRAGGRSTSPLTLLSSEGFNATTTSSGTQPEWHTQVECGVCPSQCAAFDTHSTELSDVIQRCLPGLFLLTHLSTLRHIPRHTDSSMDNTEARHWPEYAPMVARIAKLHVKLGLFGEISVLNYRILTL